MIPLPTPASPWPASAARSAAASIVEGMVGGDDGRPNSFLFLSLYFSLTYLSSLSRSFSVFFWFFLACFFLSLSCVICAYFSLSSFSRSFSVFHFFLSFFLSFCAVISLSLSFFFPISSFSSFSVIFHLFSLFCDRCSHSHSLFLSFNFAANISGAPIGTIQS